MFRRLAIALAAGIALTTLAQAAPVLRAPGGGTVKAFVVGINDYPKLPSGSQLRGAKDDALDFDRTLRKLGVTPELWTRPDQVTRAAFVRQMDRLVAEAKAGDFIIIAYAGHGMQVPEYKEFKGQEKTGNNEQIVLANYERQGAAAGEVIVNKELRAWVARLDAKGADVLVIMDSCFGGGMARGFDPRGGEAPSLRQTAGGKSDSFKPIAMTAKEATTEFSEMTHVTFISGSSRDLPVPEMPGLEPGHPRGAMSWFVARAMDQLARPGAPVTRGALYEYASQNVRQKSNDTQAIDFQPASDDAGVMGRPVLQIGDGDAPPPPPPPPPPPGGDAVRVALINGPADAAAKIARAKAPFAVVRGVEEADLIWDVGKADVLQAGDLLMQQADGSVLGRAIDRTYAKRAILKLSEPRTLSIQLASNGKLYVPGENPKAIVSGVKGRGLVVFNIASDAEIQMQFPAAPGFSGACAGIDGDSWSCGMDVTPPFGTDTLVGVSTAKEPAELLAWLRAHHGKRDAADLPQVLEKLVKSDSTTRIGTVGLYTGSGR